MGNTVGCCGDKPTLKPEPKGHAHPQMGEAMRKRLAGAADGMDGVDKIIFQNEQLAKDLK